MPKFCCFWACLLLLLITVPHVRLTSDEEMLNENNKDISEFSDSEKRDLLHKYNPFLKNIALSDDMKSLLHSKSRRKRSVKRNTNLRKSDMDKLQQIVRELASHVKRDISTSNPYIDKKIYRNYEESEKRAPKLISKKDLMNVLRTIVQETFTEAREKELNDYKKGNSMYELKRSLQRPSPSPMNNNPFKLDRSYMDPFITIEDNDADIRLVTESTVMVNDVTRAPMESRSLNDYQEKDDHETIRRILENVEALRKNRAAGSKEGFPCDVVGSWTSHMGGKVLSIAQASHNVLCINTSNCHPQREGFLTGNKWKLCGTTPFPNTGLILVTGINEECRQVTAFIGECKCCDGKEVIQGQWLIGKLARDCSDVIASQDVIGDVWRREVSHQLRNRRLIIP